MRLQNLSKAGLFAAIGLVGTEVMAAGYALSGTGDLLEFTADDPAAALTVGPVSGFTGSDTALVGIDVRVQDRKLYGVGNAGGIYLINRNTAALTPAGTLSTALSGTYFGVDFNPAADRLRVISDSGQNLRHQLGVGTTTDGALNYTGTLTPGAPAAGLVSGAYTNNDLSALTGTTLYTIDVGLDQLNVQVPANTGVQTLVGKLGVDFISPVGFDSKTRSVGGVTLGQTLFATTGSSFYEINLVTGAATLVGSFPVPVSDIAFDTPAP